MKFLAVLFTVGIIVCAIVVLSTSGAGNGNEIVASFASNFIGH